VNKAINFEIQTGTGIIHLNRPKVLNALNLEMVELFLEKLKEWQFDSSIKRVLLTGKGKALCAGGDIKSLFYSSGKSNLKKLFLQKEYTLNYAISQFSKPYLSIWDGIVMGGGIGLSIYGNARLATNKVKFAMPETAIGFFPDVGGSYFLSRLNKGIGLYLGLTGQVLNAAEILSFGLATHFQKSHRVSSIQQEYSFNGSLPDMQQTPSESLGILEHQEFIQNTFHGDLLTIINRLNLSSLSFAKKTYAHLFTRCPMSLAVTTELLKRAEHLSLKDCLKMEFQLSQHIVYRDDFNEGIDNVLVSKALNPKWNPPTINDIDFKEVDCLFDPHVEPLNI
jgi:enoyl-CoA hydratase/carnithine racemase